MTFYRRKITHAELVERVVDGELNITVTKRNAGSFILSVQADSKNRRRNNFWYWLAITLVVVIPSIFILLGNWFLALFFFLIGLIFFWYLKVLDTKIVIDNMLQDKDFCEQVLQSSGAVIRDKEGDEIEVKFKSSTTVSELITEYVIQIATELENVLEYHGINATVTEMYTGDPKYIFYVHFNKNINIHTLRKIIKNIPQLKDNLEITRKHQYPNTNYIAILIPALPQSYFTKKIKEL